MRQNGHWRAGQAMDESTFRALLHDRIEVLDVAQARSEVEPFVRHPEALKIWSREFFHGVASRIEVTNDNRS